MQVPSLGHLPTAWRPYVKKSLGVDTAQFSSSVSHTRARAHTHIQHTHTHTYRRARTHSRASPHASARACGGQQALRFGALLTPSPSRVFEGEHKETLEGETVRCLGLARVGWAPPSVPRRSLARPSGPWIKAILTEQSGLDATFPPPRLGKGGQQGESASSPIPPTIGRCERVGMGGIGGEARGPHVQGETRARPLRLSGWLSPLLSGDQPGGTGREKRGSGCPSLRRKW